MEETSSIFQPTTYRLSHTLYLEQFQNIVDTFPTGKCIRGVNFGQPEEDSACCFYLNLYPTGSKATFGGWMSIFIHLQSTNHKQLDSETDITSPLDAHIIRRYCHLRFSIMDTGGREKYTRSASHVLTVSERWPSMNNLASEGVADKTNWGYRRFCRVDEVAELLQPDGRLQLRCALTVVAPTTLNARPLTANHLDPQLQRQWQAAVGSLQCNNTLTDLVISVTHNTDNSCALLNNNPIAEHAHASNKHLQASSSTTCSTHSGDGPALTKEFHVHRCLLVAQSPVFHAMLTTEMTESRHHRVHIDDIEPSAFQGILHFVYNGTLPDYSPYNDASVRYTSLLLAADKYCLETVRVACEHRLIATLRPDNVIKVLLRLALAPTQQARKESYSLFWRKWPQVCKTEDWRLLQENSPSVALQLITSAIDMFKQQNWTDNSNPQPDNTRPITESTINVF